MIACSWPIDPDAGLNERSLLIASRPPRLPSRHVTARTSIWKFDFDLTDSEPMSDGDGSYATGQCTSHYTSWTSPQFRVSTPWRTVVQSRARHELSHPETAHGGNPISMTRPVPLWTVLRPSYVTLTDACACSASKTPKHPSLPPR
jgi:hypothetical protein